MGHSDSYSEWKKFQNYYFSKHQIYAKIEYIKRVVYTKAVSPLLIKIISQAISSLLVILNSHNHINNKILPATTKNHANTKNK